MADQNTDKLYKHIRQRFGTHGAGANGYQSQRFFRREQRQVLSYLSNVSGPIVDIACGSGLMIAPLIDQHRQALGVDFNASACQGAQLNGVPVLRGDAFHLPFADASIGQIINCQFLNQQTSEDTGRFVREVARTLVPGGQMILFWRHAQSLLHRSASTVLHLIDRVTGAPEFPQYIHPMAELQQLATASGLRCLEQAITLPVFSVESVSADSWIGGVLGASLVLVIEKPQ